MKASVSKVEPVKVLDVQKKRRVIKDAVHYSLRINGRLVKQFSVGGKPLGWQLDSDTGLGTTIRTCNAHELAKHFESVSLPLKWKWNRYITEVCIYLNKNPRQKINYVFNFYLGPDCWAEPYIAPDYIKAVQKAVKVQKDKNIGFESYSSGFVEEEFDLGFSLLPTEVPVGEQLEIFGERIRSICEVAERSVLRKTHGATLTSSFSFPAPIKTACEQYLLYFGQFLEDLGIKADSTIKEDAGRVLFSVTPKDGENALGKIKEALDIYLGLPENPNFSAASGQFGNVAVAQLRANVFYLQSQLELAKAAVQAKDAAIQALDATVFKQRQLLSDRLIDVPPDPKQTETEPIVGDTIHLKKYEGKAVNVDLPTILRRLKRVFGMGKGTPDSE